MAPSGQDHVRTSEAVCIINLIASARPATLADVKQRYVPLLFEEKAELEEQPKGDLSSPFVAAARSAAAPATPHRPGAGSPDPSPEARCMKLLHSTASPFVRKVMVFAHETGLADRLALASCVVSPVARDARVVPHNPSGHIPTLLLDGGEALYDSVVICQYLDTLHDGPPLHPPVGIARTRTLCLQALADGIMDAGVLIRFETALRPEPLHWQAWVDGQGAKIASSIESLRTTWRAHLHGPLDMGVIAVACALGYLDFRLPPQTWRPAAPDLADWYDAFALRPSMQATRLKPVA